LSQTIEIPLASSKGVALIDAADYPLVSGYKWFFSNGYAARTTQVVRGDGRRSSTTLYMHRVIAGFPSDVEVDHKNRNGLDNRRSNLRPATHRQNLENVKGGYGVSGVRGVVWDKKKKRWRAQLKTTINGKQRCIQLGRFRNLEDADRAAQAGRRLYFTHSDDNDEGETS
jgi:hypothetical protein